jgi:fibronectin-binding autotransporter adhesin
LSLAQAAQITGYHQDYLGQLARTGKLPAQKIGRNWVTTIEAVYKLKEGGDPSVGTNMISDAIENPEVEKAMPITSDALDQIKEQLDVVQSKMSQQETKLVEHADKMVQHETKIQEHQGKIFEHEKKFVPKEEPVVVPTRPVNLQVAHHHAQGFAEHEVPEDVVVDAEAIGFTKHIVHMPKYAFAVLLFSLIGVTAATALYFNDDGNLSNTKTLVASYLPQGENSHLGLVAAATQTQGIPDTITQIIYKIINVGGSGTGARGAKGDQGDIGPVGPPGPVGPAGAPGMNVSYIVPTSPNGPVGSLLGITYLSSKDFITETAKVATLIFGDGTSMTTAAVTASDFDSDITLNGQSDLRFADADSSNWVAFQAPAIVGGNVTWTLPATDSSGCLQSDGVGNLSFGSCGGGSGALSGLSAAIGPNTLNSGDNAQTWNWSLNTASKSAFTFGENVASSNGVGAQYILQATTLGGSTATPLYIKNLGNAVSFQVDDQAGDGSPFVIDAGGNVTTGGTINTASISGGSLSGGSVSGGSLTAGAVNGVTTANIVVTSGSYADPAWVTSLSGAKVSGNIPGNAVNVTGTVAVANGGTGTNTLNDLITLGTHTQGNYVTSTNTASGSGLTGGSTGSEGAALSLSVLLPSATDNLSATTSSGSGLEKLASGLTLVQGCSNGQILKWNEATDLWECNSDVGASSATLQAAYDTGATITTSNARDLAINLADTATDSNFAITIADNSTSTVSIVRADGGGSNDPAQLLFLDNANANRSVAAGLKITSSGMNNGIINALDVSEANIQNALAIGSNNISGTSFSVTGSNGNVTAGNISSGTINGQTISSAATFTGTVAFTTLGTTNNNTILCQNNSNQLAGCSALTDAQISDTLTASVFVGSGSTTNAVDLATAEVNGTLAVSNGGTGAASFTTGGILLGGVTISDTGVLTNGQILIGDGSGAPTIGTISGTANQVTAGTGAGTITLSLPNDLRAPDLFNATTSIATGAGAGTVRIDASGNLTNIGNITSGAAATYGTSTGDLTIAAAGSNTGNIIIGGAASSTPDLLVVGRKSDAGNPTAVDGAVYYNANGGKFYIAEGGSWKEICNKTDAACGAGSGSAWSALADPAGNLSLNMAEFTTSFTWDTGSTAATKDYMTLSVTNDGSTDVNNQRVLVLQNNDSTGSTTTERLLVLNNADSDEAVTTALEISSAAGAVTTAIDVSDPDIGTAISFGANDITGSNFTITGSNGNVTSGTINSQTISAAASFTGTVTVATSVAAPIFTNAGALAISTTASNGAISFSPNGSGDVTLTADNDTQLSVSGTITDTGEAVRIAPTLGNDVGADTVSGLTIAATSANTGDADVLYALDLTVASSDATVTESAIHIGSGWDNVIDDNGTLISATELNRLDGKDAALVDVNDAVVTAITGTGALDSGSITSGFGSIDTGTDNITTTGTVSGNSLTRSSSGLLSIGTTNATSITIGSGSVTSITLTTDGTGDGEIVLPGNSIGNAELVNSSVTVTAGSGLINGGSVSLGGSTTLDIGAGTGITVNANDVAIDQSFAPTWTGVHTFTQTVTNTGFLTDFNLTLGNDGDADTVSAINIDVTSAATADADLVYGINIADLTTASAVVTETALRFGANWENVIDDNGTLISATELNLLDGHDVALVDTNDAVSTAIIGTGALNSGSITSGFGAIDVGADNITTTGTVSGNSLTRSSAGLLSIGTTNATSITIGSGSVTSITLTTDGTGDGEIVLPTGSISGTEILDDTVTLNTDTNGNYVASISNGTGITGGNGGSEAATLTLAIDQSFAPTWTGVHTFTQTVTNTGFLTDFNLTLGNDGDADTVSAINIDVTSAATADADLVYGINIADLTTASAVVTETALRFGANWENVIDDNGTLISATELNLLDGHDVALVDTNDAVSTAIIGTGALNSGSITSGFGAIDVGADNITTTGTVSGNSLTRSSAGLLSIGTTNATSITIGSGSVTSITLTTDGTGDGEIVLPGNSIGNAELVNSSVTVTAGNGLVTGGSVSLGGSVTLDVNAGTGIALSADAVTVDQSFAPTWTGVHTFTQTVTNTGFLTDFNLTLGNDGDADTVSAINIDVTSAATADADLVYGINIADLTTASAVVTETALRFGANWENVIDDNGTLISATELNLLDGHDVALVDTNDAVSTAIIGTGALNSGSITSGFGSIDTGADTITTSGTIGTAATTAFTGATGVFSTSTTSPSFTGTGAVTLSSGGASALTLDSASNILVIAANDTTLQRTAAGTYTINLVDGSNTVLALTNSGAGAANLQVDGLGGNGVRCLQTDNTGNVSVAGSACGSSGGDSITVNSSAATDANFLDVAATGTVTGTTWTLDTAPSPDNITLSVSNASTTVAGSVTTGTQTFAGAKTFNGGVTVTDSIVQSKISAFNPTTLGGANVAQNVDVVVPEGKYLYVGSPTIAGTCNATTATGCELRIYDIHDPSTPTFVGGADLGAGIESMVINGKYAYILSDTNLAIYDISNPSSPSSVTTIAGVNTQSLHAVFISGKYLYFLIDANAGTCNTTTATGCEFRIYDISNPASPTFVGGVNLGIAGLSVYVVGKYAYVTNADVAGTCSGATQTGCELHIYDISNPANITAIGGADTGGGSFSAIYVSGKYVYTTMSTGSGFKIYDVSNPAAPVNTSTVNLADHVLTLAVAGKYLYIGVVALAGTCSGATVTGCELQIYDISAPASPTAVGGLDFGVAVNSFKVQGKYGYLALDSVSGNDWRIIDLAGIDAPTATIGAVASNSIVVSEDARIENNLYVGTALTVGVEGINSNGPIAIMGNTQGQALNIIQGIATTGSPTGFAFTAGAHTTLTASTEATDINFALNRTVQFTGSSTPGAANIASQRAIRVQAPTYAFSSSGAQTITDAASFEISGAPSGGSNATLTSSHALWIEGGTVANTTSGYGLSVNAPTGATTNYAAQFLGGNVGIGDSAPTQKLTVTNGIIQDKVTAFNPTTLGGADLGTTSFQVAVQGQYAYVVTLAVAGTCNATTATGCEFRIYDIHNPSSPTFVGGEDSGLDLGSVVVSGKYAYYGKRNAASSTVVIDDVGNPSAPTNVGTISLGSAPFTMSISGKYLYITSAIVAGTCSITTATGCEFRIYDISNPASPSFVGGIDSSGLLGVYVSGKYAYISGNVDAGTCSGATVTGCEIKIYDISNPNNPTAVGGLNTGTDINTVYVSGKYLYFVQLTNAGTCSGSTVTGCEFGIVDISNPSTPTGVGGSNIGSDTYSLVVAGNYAYVGLVAKASTCLNGTVTGCEFRIYDISNPTTISAVGGLDETVEVDWIAVAGKYAYLSLDTVSGNDFRVIDLAGLDAPTASIGALATGSIQVSEDTNINGNLYVGTGMQVGVGGITSLGPVGILGNTQGQVFNATQGIATGGSPTGFTFTGGAHTTLAASTEAIDVNFALNRTVQFTNGTLTTQRAFVVQAPTYAFSSASTLTTAATFDITGAPAAGTNATITSSYALFVEAGITRLAGAVKINLPGTGTANALCHTTQSGTTNEEIVDCTSAPAADYSEMYPAAPNVEEGDIVMPTQTVVTTTQNDHVAILTKADPTLNLPVIGVVSRLSDVSDFNNIGNNIEIKDNPMPIALNGRVLVKVTEENGPIQVGDALTLSQTLPGYAMKQTESGDSIGVAMENSSAGTDKIMVFLRLGYKPISVSATEDGNQIVYNQPLDLNNNSLLNVKSITSANGKWSIDENGNLVVETIKAKQLCLDDVCINKDQLQQLLQQGSPANTPTPPAVEPPSTQNPDTTVTNPTTDPVMVTRPDPIITTPPDQTTPPATPSTPSTENSPLATP